MTVNLATSLIERSILLSDIPLERNGLCQSILNIENKNRSNLFPWNGQFSPQLVEALLAAYAKQDDVIFDPFAGSGTILYESGRKQITAYASEINPAAYIMASTYRLMNQPLAKRQDIIQKINEILAQSLLDNDLPLFSAPPQLVAPVETKAKASISNRLLQYWHSTSNPMIKAILAVLIIRLDAYQEQLTSTQVLATWGKLKDLILQLSYTSQPLQICNCDARQNPLPTKSVDLVITSPPYINVFNYHQQYRTATEALGWNLLTVAQSEIGSNRKHRSNRFLTVIQYCLDLSQTFVALAPILKPSAQVIFVVGRESRVRGIPFLNGDIVSLIATNCSGYAVSGRQERTFKNRFGQLICEDILYFAPNNHKITSAPLDKAKTLATLVLENALKIAPLDVQPDIKEALQKLPTVLPSKMFAAQNASILGH